MLKQNASASLNVSHFINEFFKQNKGNEKPPERLTTVTTPHIWLGQNVDL